MNRKIDPGEKLILDGLLRDEEWQSGNACVKAGALRAFQAHRRNQRLAKCVLGLACVAVLAAAALRWNSHTTQPLAHQIAPRPAAVGNTPTYMSDAELLAAFPKGSCFLADVGGHKELIFIDPALERQYMAKPK